jgi:hypothetical protein
MLTLNPAQRAILVDMLDHEVQSQIEDPTTPWALDEAEDLRAALERGEDVGGYPLARIMAEEVDLRGDALREAVAHGDAAEVRRHAGRIAVAGEVLGRLS